MRTYLLDWLLRTLRDELAKESTVERVVMVHSAGPAIVNRSCIYFASPSRVELAIGLASHMVGSIMEVLQGPVEDALRRAVRATLARLAATPPALSTLLDRWALRSLIRDSSGAAFVANGCLLARDDASSSAAASPHVVPFTSPPSLERTFTLPHSGDTVTGMLVPAGVTVITGGGFHGKSTLLRALAMGAHDLVPGDGREWCITAGTSTTIRSEDGRSISNVDISPFISDLPAAVAMDVENFSTRCGSGSTSQAAAVVEGIEMGCSLFLLDEDTCAGNFMIRDSRLRSLIEREPITPFIYRVNSLYKQLGISSIVVIGGSGDWFDVQDATLQLDNFQCLDVTRRVAQISKTFCTGRVTYNGQGLVHQLLWTHSLRRRYPARSLFKAPLPGCSPTGGGFLLSASEDGGVLRYGSLFSLDLSKVDQRVEGRAGALGIGVALYWLGNDASAAAPPHQPLSVSDILAAYNTQRGGCLMYCYAALTAHETYVLPLPSVLASALNRIRGATFKIE